MRGWSSIHRAGLLLALAVFPLGRADAGGQKAVPTLEQIIQIWKARQEKVRTARFEWTSRETIHKGSISIMTEILGKVPPKGIQPPRDIPGEGTGQLCLSGVKLRYAHDLPRWSVFHQALYRERYQDTFDGKLSQWLRVSVGDTPDNNYPISGVRKRDRSESANLFAILPIILTVRGDHPQFEFDLGSYEVTGRKSTIAGRPCIELVREFKSAHERRRYYLDTEHDYVVVRKVTITDNQPTWQLDVSYVPDPQIGWVPKSWEHVIRVRKNQKSAFQVHESGRLTVTHYELNGPVSDTEFQLALPVGTRVVDLEKGVQYVIRDDGKKGKEVLTSSAPTYQELQAAGPAPSGRVRGILIGVAATVLILAVAGLFWLRRHRIQTTPSGPSDP